MFTRILNGTGVIRANLAECRLQITLCPEKHQRGHECNCARFKMLRQQIVAGWNVAKLN